jgi:hypothetical protein
MDGYNMYPLTLTSKTSPSFPPSLPGRPALSPRLDLIEVEAHVLLLLAVVHRHVDRCLIDLG